MRKKPLILTFLVLSGLGFVAPGPARPEYVGGPGNLKEGVGVSIEPQFGIVIRDLDSEEDESITSLRFFVRPALTFKGRIAVYANLGMADLHQGEFDGALGLLAGGGAKIFLINASRYLNLYLDGQFHTFQTAGDRDRRFWAYQGAVLISHASENWNVYGGGKYSEFTEDGGDNAAAADKVGIIIGIDYSVTPMVFFTGEMHNFSDDALYLGVGYRF